MKKGEKRTVEVSKAEYDALAQVVSGADRLGLNGFEADLLRKLLGKIEEA